MKKEVNQEEFPKLFLEREYQKRLAKNPRYSLRAFAKSLGMSHTVLSLVLNKKRRLSQKAAHRIANHFGLDPKKRQLLLSSNRKQNYEYFDDYEQIDLDTFSLIADWENYALLSLLEILGAKFETKWVAKRLGITEFQAKTTMDRMLRLGMIKLQEDGTYKQSMAPIKVGNTVSTTATRRFHRQLIEKALHSLENDPQSVRDMSSMTFAMNPKDIPFAIEKIREFRRTLSQELENRSAPKEVYNLTVQLYPVSQKIEEDK